MEKIVNNNSESDKEKFLSNFENSFVNNPPTKCIVDLNIAKNGFDLISKTAKSGRVLGACALLCLPLNLTFGVFDERVMACLGVACVASLGAGFLLTSYSKRKYDKFMTDKTSMDFINYSVYRQNEKLKKLMQSTQSNDNKQKLIISHLVSLLETQDSLIDNLNASEIVFDDLFDTYDGNLNDVIKKRDLEFTKIYTSYDYVSKHISDNAELYSTFAPEFQPSIDASIELTKEVENINEEFLSQEYIRKRRDVAHYNPIEKNFIEHFEL